MARDTDVPGGPAAAREDETGGRALDRRALLLGAAAAGAGVATLAGGAGTADAQPVQYVRLASESRANTTTWIQTTAGTGFLGVQDNASGLLAGTTPLVAGVAGDSDAVDGVLGASSAANGVHGISSANGSSGVLGADTSTSGGSGVQGESTNGIGVLASSANGTALKVEGPAQLTGSLSADGQITGASLATTGEVAAGSLTATGAVSAQTLAVTGEIALGRSGATTVFANRKTVQVSVPGMTHTSLVIATCQGKAVTVAVACVEANDGYFIIHMNQAPRRNTRIAWLVLN